MGTFERPRPARAEARRSGRSLRNVVLAAEAAHGLATALADWPCPRAMPPSTRCARPPRESTTPRLQDVDTPQGRLRAEVLQQAVTGLREDIAGEIGARYGIAPGFNSQDGD